MPSIYRSTFDWFFYIYEVFTSFYIITLSEMFNAIGSHFSIQFLAFQLIFSAWPRLPHSSTKPRRVIRSYSGSFQSFQRAEFGLSCCNSTGSLTHNLKSFTVPVTQQQVYKLAPPSSEYTKNLSLYRFGLVKYWLWLQAFLLANP